MVSRLDPRLERIPFIERPAVAAGTNRRLFGRRAMMMAALTERVFVSMKIADQLVIVNIAKQVLDNFAMRHLHRPVLVAQCFYLDIFRYIRLGKRMNHGDAGIKHHGRQIFFSGMLNAFGNPVYIRHMAGLASTGVLLAGPGNTVVTTGTFGVPLAQIMTAQAAGIYIETVH